MKLNIVIAITGVIGMIVSGVLFLRPLITNYQTCQQLEEYATSEEIKAQQLTNEANSLVSSFSEGGYDYLFSNTESANKMSSLEGAKLQSIVALHLNGGEYDAILAIENSEDVEFFTEDTDAIRYDFEIKNQDKFLHSLQETKWILIDLDLDLDKNLCSITIPSSSSLQAGTWQTSVGTSEGYDTILEYNTESDDSVGEGEGAIEVDSGLFSDTTEEDLDQMIIEY